MKRKRRLLELGMAGLLLLSILVLAREELYGVHKASKSTDNRRIVVDAGHGGSDPGKVGIDGVLEKDVNLSVVKILQKELERRGFDVILTRETDAGLYKEGTPNQKVQDLQNRCKIIEENKPFCTLSIHQNSYTDASVCGPQVFYFTHSEEAERLAASLQDSLNTGLDIAKPRVQKENSSYYILKRSTSVTVLIECGFLSNPEEAKKLAEKDYQKQMARAICDGLEKYVKSAPSV